MTPVCVPVSFLDRVMIWLGWTPPAPARPRRARRARAICPNCGKDLAVVRSTGLVWHHTCQAVFDTQATALADSWRLLRTSTDGLGHPVDDAQVPSDAGCEGRR